MKRLFSLLSTQDDHMQAALNEFVLQNLRPLSAGLGIIFLIFGIAFSPPPVNTENGTIILLVSAGFMLGQFVLLTYLPLSTKWAYPLSILIVIVASLNALYSLYAVQNPIQSTSIMLVVVGIGFFFLSTRWYLTALLVVLISWGVIFVTIPASIEKSYIWYVMGAATLLSGLIHIVRVRNFLQEFRLRQLIEAQKSELETAIQKNRAQLLAQQQSEENFRVAFDRTPIAMAISTVADGTYLYVNDSFLKLFYFERHEVIGKKSADMSLWVNLEDRERFIQIFFEKGFVKDFEYTSYIRTGQVRNVVAHAEPIEINGQSCILALIQDITDYRAAINALRESEQECRRLFVMAERQTQELTLVGRVHTALSMELELSALIRTVIHAIEDTCGYPLVSIYLLQQDVLHLQYQVGYDQVIEEVPANTGIARRVVQTKKPVLVTQADDDPAFLKAMPDITSEVCVPLFEQDEVVGVLILEETTRSLTEADLRLMMTLSEQINIGLSRARLHSEIRQSEERYRTLIEQLPVGVYRSTLGRNGRFLMVNRALANMLGFKNEDELMTQSPSAFYAEPQARQYYSDSLLKNGSFSGEEIKGKKQDGTIIWVLASAQVIYDAEGTPLYFDGTIQDINERKRIEETFRQAKKMESLGILAGGIAHEFNNLLAAIIAQNSIAQAKAGNDSPVAAHLGKSIDVAKRAATLTEKMLAYSGHGHFEIKSQNLNDLIGDSIQLWEVAMPPHVTIETVLEAELPLIEIDAVQIQQLIINLIVNGAESIADEETRLVTITTGAEVVQNENCRLYSPLTPPPAPGHYVTLKVQDNGSGMDAEMIAKIFDPFFSTKFTGRGLGLAVVLGIINGHKGSLRIESKLGEGTTFTICLPVHGTETAVIPKFIPEETKPLPHITPHVLVIDDEMHVREAVTDTLEIIDIPVYAASNGREGIEMFKTYQREIVLILLDMSMPGLSGLETLAALREIDPEIGVIISSGYSQSSLGSQLENVSFLQKPYDIDQLIDIVERHLA